MKTTNSFKMFSFVLAAIVAMFLVMPTNAQAGWDKTGIKDSGVTYYDSNSSNTYLQTAIVGGSYTNVASPNGTVTSGWDSSAVQAGVAYGCSTGNCQIKQSSDGSSWYAIVDFSDLINLF